MTNNIGQWFQIIYYVLFLFLSAILF